MTHTMSAIPKILGSPTRQRPPRQRLSSNALRVIGDYVRQADLNEAALRRTHSRVAEPTVDVI